MPYLIDTYNCIHAGSALGGAFSQLTVRKLCQWITTSPRNPKCTLILDGRKKPDEPDETEFPSISFRYSGTGITADAAIAQIIERSQSRKKITVITNDRAVALHARKNYANAQSCESFLNELLRSHPGGKNVALPPQKTSGSPTRGETDHWLKEFGITPPPPPPPPANLHDPDDPDNLDIKKLLGEP